ncbi:hypothetical protein FOVG_17003 [Fusarium oxysporum f. sp. pisi HDV247]|uniref:Uncharacterized protein n=1 Tax=Fusarium oxysporum f. sp. pisi HDV247 TaxID=1080344 RepID=W9NLZ0_FUSOX|nr:hypothetical protein FOVG_17003 [Fusarium oxysporum f. sp. pisi HDV247]
MTSGRALSLEYIADLIALALKDQRARRIIKPFLTSSFKLYYILGRDKGKYYAYTTGPGQEDNHIIIYI